MQETELEAGTQFAHGAQDEIDRLYNALRAAGYVVLVSKSNGRAIVAPLLRSKASIVFQARPRPYLLRDTESAAPSTIMQGGLSPETVHRIRKYIDKRLTERIQLADLAIVAGLSIYHFAREFKRAVGVPPHSYIMQKRVEKAQYMLAHTDFPLCDIGPASGFFDQSHLARHLRELAGVTPAEYRRKTRREQPTISYRDSSLQLSPCIGRR